MGRIVAYLDECTEREMVGLCKRVMLKLCRQLSEYASDLNYNAAANDDDTETSISREDASLLIGAAANELSLFNVMSNSLQSIAYAGANGGVGNKATPRKRQKRQLLGEEKTPTIQQPGGIEASHESPNGDEHNDDAGHVVEGEVDDGQMDESSADAYPTGHHNGFLEVLQSLADGTHSATNQQQQQSSFRQDHDESADPNDSTAGDNPSTSNTYLNDLITKIGGNVPARFNLPTMVPMQAAAQNARQRAHKIKQQRMRQQKPKKEQPLDQSGTPMDDLTVGLDARNIPARARPYTREQQAKCAVGKLSLAVRCHICLEFESDSMKKMQMHMKERHNIQYDMHTFQCPTCQYTSTSTFNIKRHASRVHKEEASFLFTSLGENAVIAVPDESPGAPAPPPNMDDVYDGEEQEQETGMAGN